MTQALQNEKYKEAASINFIQAYDDLLDVMEKDEDDTIESLDEHDLLEDNSLRAPAWNNDGLSESDVGSGDSPSTEANLTPSTQSTTAPTGTASTSTSTSSAAPTVATPTTGTNGDSSTSNAPDASTNAL
jgi:hypothetical protein